MKKLFVIIITLFQLVNAVAQQDVPIPQLASQLKNVKGNVERFRIIGKICNSYMQRGIMDSSNFYLQQLLDIAQTEKNDSLFIMAYTYVGNNFIATGNYPMALQYHFKAMNLAEKNNRPSETGLTSSNIGWTYILLKNYPAAVTFCKKAIQYSAIQSRGEKYLVAAYDNLAIAFLEQKLADSALTYTQLANTLNLKVNNISEQSYIYYQFARIYQLLNETKLAESFFIKSIEYSIAHQNAEALTTAATYYCRLLLEQSRITDAKQYGLMGMRSAIATGKKRQAIDNAEIMHRLYRQEKQVDSAYYYLQMSVLYRDSVFTEQKNFQLQDVIFSQQLHEQEVAQEKQKEEEQRKHNLQYALIALALVSFVILFFIFSHSIVANQKLIRFLGVIALLIVFEFINLYIHPYLAHVTHDAPLPMLLVMVCIAALLVPLHHRMEHWIIHRLVEKNNRIRLAAAKRTIAQLEGK